MVPGGHEAAPLRVWDYEIILIGIRANDMNDFGWTQGRAPYGFEDYGIILIGIRANDMNDFGRTQGRAPTDFVSFDWDPGIPGGHKAAPLGVLYLFRGEE